MGNLQFKRARNHLIPPIKPGDQGLDIWFDAINQRKTFGTNNKISIWENISSNGLNAEQATSTNQASIGMGNNGLPTMQFESNSTYSTSINYTFATEGVLFAVAIANESAINSIGHVCTQWGAGVNREFTLGKFNSSQNDCFYLANVGNNILSGVNATSKLTTVTIMHDPNLSKTGEIYINGILKGQEILSFEPHANNFTIGSSWHGEICEIIAFSLVLDPARRRQIEEYLMNKWRI